MKKLSAQSKFLIGTTSFLVLSGIFCLTSGIVVAFNRKKDSNNTNSTNNKISLKKENFSAKEFGWSQITNEDAQKLINNLWIFENKNKIFTNSTLIIDQNTINNVQVNKINNVSLQINFQIEQAKYQFVINEFQTPISLKQDLFSTSNLNSSSYLIETLLNKLNSEFIFNNKTNIFNNSDLLNNSDQIKNFVKEIVDDSQAISVSFTIDSQKFTFKIIDFVKVKTTEAQFTDFSWNPYSTNKELIDQINSLWLFNNKNYFFDNANNLEENQFSKLNVLSSIEDKTIIINFELEYQQNLTFKIMNVEFMEDIEFLFNNSVKNSSFSSWKGNNDIFRKTGINKGLYALIGETNFWDDQYNDWNQNITKTIFTNRLKTILNISSNNVEADTSENFVVKFSIPFDVSHDSVFSNVFGKSTDDIKKESQYFTNIQNIQFIFQFDPKEWVDLAPYLPLFRYNLKTISINFTFDNQKSYQVIIYQNVDFQIVSALYNSGKENEWSGKSNNIVNIRTLELYDFQNIPSVEFLVNPQTQIIDNNKKTKDKLLL